MLFVALVLLLCTHVYVFLPMLFQGLKRLTFGEEFNQPVESVSWPPSLERLIFVFFFNQVMMAHQRQYSRQQLSVLSCALCFCHGILPFLAADRSRGANVKQYDPSIYRGGDGPTTH